MKPTALDFSSAESALGVKLIENGRGTQALHDVVVGYQANRRAGTHSTKTKATVKASGKKPWRQKGTGRARAGYVSSPVWVGGGVVFGPAPRDYSKTLSKSLRQVALKKAISEAAKSGRLHTVKSLGLTAPKTKELSAKLASWDLAGSLLLVTAEVDKNLYLASRNIPKVEVVPAADLNAEQVVAHKQVLLLEGAYATLSNRLK
jgi:large subunit ribosomal protein L4